MTSLGKIYPHYVIDTVNCTILRFFCSDDLLTAVDANLKRFKFTILFTIADVLGKIKKTNACYQSIQK